MVGLPELNAALRAAGYTRVPRYGQLYLEVASGNMPEAEKIGGRWKIQEAALPSVAARLGLTRTAEAWL